jgi:hypothetical protein
MKRRYDVTNKNEGGEHTNALEEEKLTIPCTEDGISKTSQAAPVL